MAGARQVLVVDDDREIGKLIRYNLEDEDTRVFQAASALEGIRILVEAKVDLVLLDLSLPDFSGWGMLSLLRLTEPMRHIPVIVVSVEPADSSLMERLRPEGYVQKPFDMRDLLAQIKRVIGADGAERLANRAT